MIFFHRFLVLLVILLPYFSTQAQHFQQGSKPDFGDLSKINFEDLCIVSKNTQEYLNRYQEDSFAVHDGAVFGGAVTLSRVKETLTFICDVVKQDENTEFKRLADKSFLQNHFEFIRWTPDKKTANEIASKSTNEIKTRMLNNIPSDKLFITKYYTKLLNGSEVKTAEFSQALYAIPKDEAELTLEQADSLKNNLTRYKFTRQDIINGALLKEDLAKPLIWISEEALHDVLLQGTGVLKVGDTIRYFNVHRNNGIAYDYAIGKREQARYWYFAEVPSIMGYGTDIENKIPILPKVTFAGNVGQLGLGKLFMMTYDVKGQSESRLAILADRGGAFDNNLFQLDYLVDSYRGWSDYHQANKHLPDYARVWLMLKK